MCFLFSYYVIARRFWAIFLQAPRVAENSSIHFGNATRGWLEIIQSVVVEIAA
jgi:hypothetical protein